MKNTIAQLLSLLFATIILVSCNKSEQNPSKNSIAGASDSEGFFKGIIKLEEESLIEKSYITLTFSGNDVKRETKKNGLDNISYGMIYRKGNDSVEYYYTKEGKTWHTLIEKKDFQKWVQILERPTIKNPEQFDRSFAVEEPFGTIFQPTGISGEYVLLNTFEAKLKDLPSVKSQTFILPDKLASCQVWYSEDLKIRPEILEMIEYNQPKSIKTLALQVQYFAKDGNGEAKNTVEKVFEKINKVTVKLEKKLNTKSINSTDNISIDLPANSEKTSLEKLDNIINPPDPNNNGRGSHHDIFD